MRHFETELEIAAPIGRVWEILMDVRRWPEWTRSISRVEPLEEGPMRLHSRVRMIQPKLRPAIWRITEFSEGDKFVWVSKSPGVMVTGGHFVRPGRDGTTVTLTLDMTGILSGIVASLAGKLTEEYMSYEIEGLKRRSEEARTA